jgi:hypothetical protein
MTNLAANGTATRLTQVSHVVRTGFSVGTQPSAWTRLGATGLQPEMQTMTGQPRGGQRRDNENREW